MPTNKSEYQKQYMREWRKKNKEKYLKYQREFMRKKKENNKENTLLNKDNSIKY